MSAVSNYFDLRLGPSDQRRVATAGMGKTLHWLPQYLALILGILIQPFFASFQDTGTWSFEGITARVLFSLIVGLVIFPGVYRSSIDPEKPILVQFGVIFTAGLGWETLLAAATQATGIT